jgi:hypothetical protein
MPSFYDTTIAPSTTRFFSDVQADPRLTSRTKAQLQGTMLSGLQDVEAQRAKMQEERDQSAMRQLQYETGSLNLEQAKMDRKRLEDSAAKGAAMDADLGAVLDSDTDYETKSANLAKVQMKYSDLTTNPAIRYKLDAAKDAIIRPLPTRPLMTPAQEFQMGQEGVDPEDLGGSPFAALGKKSRQAKSAEEQKKLDLEAQKEQDKALYDLLTEDIEFEKSDDLPDGAQAPQWLKPKSHEVAKMLSQFGTPDEKKKFEAAGPANDDVTRANIARDIQRRMLLDRMRKNVTDPLKPTAQERAALLMQ